MKILITRPIDEAISLSKRLEKMGFSTQLEPLIEVKILDDSDHSYLNSYEAAIISSKNAIKAIKNSNKKIKLIIVGKESTKFAKSLGFINSIYGGQNVEELKQSITDYSNLIYLTGTTITDDLCTIQKNISRKIVYSTSDVKIVSDSFINFIKDTNLKIALFFSAETARIFRTLILENKLTLFTENIIALTLSPKIVHNLVGLNFKYIASADEPSLESMIKLIQSKNG